MSAYAMPGLFPPMNGGGVLDNKNNNNDMRSTGAAVGASSASVFPQFSGMATLPTTLNATTASVTSLPTTATNTIIRKTTTNKTMTSPPPPLMTTTTTPPSSYLFSNSTHQSSFRKLSLSSLDSSLSFTSAMTATTADMESLSPSISSTSFREDKTDIESIMDDDSTIPSIEITVNQAKLDNHALMMSLAAPVQQRHTSSSKNKKSSSTSQKSANHRKQQSHHRSRVRQRDSTSTAMMKDDFLTSPEESAISLDLTLYYSHGSCSKIVRSLSSLRRLHRDLVDELSYRELDPIFNNNKSNNNGSCRKVQIPPVPSLNAGYCTSGRSWNDDDDDESDDGFSNNNDVIIGGGTGYVAMHQMLDIYPPKIELWFRKVMQCINPDESPSFTEFLCDSLWEIKCSQENNNKHPSSKSMKLESIDELKLDEIGEEEDEDDDDEEDEDW